ncbi:hypothetical protein [Ruegeria meonggei]|uniref:Uncharacterized protein n=1 Tax=Ruegeria meonggei TaxID=1446476 RepID=A0A1X6Z3E7_9RHOB|nr:hypothetical protein [Ruegeria meonggei]SLN39759.1 hypothetical protein RUM8411_01784 [Ruegeria meonggei]
MRPPGRPKKTSLSLRDLIGQALNEPTISDKGKSLLKDASKLLEGLQHGKTTALDLRLARDGSGQFEAVIEQASELGFSDRQVIRLKDAIGILAQIKLKDGRGLEDLLWTDSDDIGNPDRPGDVTVPDFPRIDVSVFGGFLEAELKTPSVGLELDAIANGALAGLRKQLPELLPREPIAVGALGAALPLAPKILEPLMQLAAVGKSGGKPNQDDPKPKPIIWDDGTSELVVFVGEVTTKTGKDVLSVTIPVATDAGRTEMIVPFAMGNPERVAGLVAAAPDRPVGDALIADIWGETLIAFAYQMVLEVADSIAGASGRDVSNKRLVAQGLSLQDGALVVQSQARFRIRGGSK